MGKIITADVKVCRKLVQRFVMGEVTFNALLDGLNGGGDIVFFVGKGVWRVAVKHDKDAFEDSGGVFVKLVILTVKLLLQLNQKWLQTRKQGFDIHGVAEVFGTVGENRQKLGTFDVTFDLLGVKVNTKSAVFVSLYGNGVRLKMAYKNGRRSVYKILSASYGNAQFSR
jgi:hypothetical protein